MLSRDARGHPARSRVPRFRVMGGVCATGCTVSPYACPSHVRPRGVFPPAPGPQPRERPCPATRAGALRSFVAGFFDEPAATPQNRIQRVVSAGLLPAENKDLGILRIKRKYSIKFKHRF